MVTSWYREMARPLCELSLALSVRQVVAPPAFANRCHIDLQHDAELALERPSEPCKMCPG